MQPLTSIQHTFNHAISSCPDFIYRIYPWIGRTFFPEKWDRNWGCGLYAGTRTRPQQFFFPMKTIESLGCGQYAGAAYLRVNTVICKIRKFLSPESMKTLVHVFVTSHLDYCNSLLFGIPKYQTDCL